MWKGKVGEVLAYLFNIGVEFLLRVDLLDEFLELALAQQTHTTFIEFECGLLDDGWGAEDRVGRGVGTTGKGRPARGDRHRNRLRNREILGDRHALGLSVFTLGSSLRSWGHLVRRDETLLLLLLLLLWMGLLLLLWMGLLSRLLWELWGLALCRRTSCGLRSSGLLRLRRTRSRRGRVWTRRHGCSSIRRGRRSSHHLGLGLLLLLLSLLLNHVLRYPGNLLLRVLGLLLLLGIL